MSGTTKTPRSCRILCASGVVGPLAPSTISFALMSLTFSSVICFSSAAGTRMSTSSLKTSAGRAASPPGKPATVLFFATHSCSFGMSRPLSFWTPPFQSVTPMIFAPCSRHQLAPIEPTLPKP
jgi:hypothetical protein